MTNRVLGTRSRESSVSSVPFWKISICTNTPKYSLFDMPRTTEIDHRILKIIPDKLGSRYQEGIPYLCEFFFIFHALIPTFKHSLFNAPRIAEIDHCVLKISLSCHHFAYQLSVSTPAGGETPHSPVHIIFNTRTGGSHFPCCCFVVYQFFV